MLKSSLKIVYYSIPREFIEEYNFQRPDQTTATAVASERTTISTSHPRQCKTSDNGGGGIRHHISVLLYRGDFVEGTSRTLAVTDL